MRRRSALLGLVLMLLAGCSAVLGPQERGYQVTYTVELLTPHYQGGLEVEYVEGLLEENHTVQVQTPPSKTWSIDVWVQGAAQLQAAVPEDAIDVFRDVVHSPSAGFPIRCRVTVNGVEVGNQQRDNLCSTTAYLPGDRDDLGEPTERFPARTHPPELWSETTEPAPTTTAPAGPRPETCRYATDAEIADIVQRTAPSLYFTGATSGYPHSCLYRFADAVGPGTQAGFSPLAGVTVARYPTPLTGVQGDPVPGVSGAARVTDHEVSGNVGGQGLTVMVDLGSTSVDIAVSEAVYELVRSRV